MSTYKESFKRVLEVLSNDGVNPSAFHNVYQQLCNLVVTAKPMSREALQRKLDHENIRKLINRINLLEDRLDQMDKRSSLRPDYHPELDDNGLPIA